MADTREITATEFIDEVRALMQRLPEVAPLSSAERKTLHNAARVPDEEVQAAINVVGASEKVAQTLGKSAGEVRQVVRDANEWSAAESELRGALRIVTDANLARRQRAAVIATQTYGIARQLIRDPANAELVTHVEELKRLKALHRRKSNTPSSETTD
jgi:hypothetical protein